MKRKPTSLFRLALRLVLPSAGLVRVTVYGISMALCLAAFAGWAAYASAKEAALGAGRQLADLSAISGNRGEVYWVNGERFHRAGLFLDEPVAVVLDRFERHCTENLSVIGQTLRDIPDALYEQGQIEPPRGSFRNGLIREDDGETGMVICFVDDRPGGLSELTERLGRFAESLNLGEFGRFRYGYAERTEDGKTHLVALWADTELNIGAMFPAAGDAAGRDPEVLPRPPKARRTLSAAAENHPFGVFIYESAGSPDQARAFYDDWATTNGWQVIQAPDDPSKGRAYLSPDGFQAFLAVGRKASHTYVSLTEAGGKMVSVEAIRGAVE